MNADETIDELELLQVAQRLRAKAVGDWVRGARMRGALSTPLWPAMMECLDIDSIRAAEETRIMRRIARTCATCTTVRRCRRWIESEAAGDPFGYRGFCPNALYFDELPRRPAAAPAAH